MPTAAASIYYYSTSGLDRLGLRAVDYVLLDEYTETPTRTKDRILGISGACVHRIETDPRMIVSLSGEVRYRAGIANAGPGAVVTNAMLANFTGPSGNDEDHYGWDTGTAGLWIAGDPTYSQRRGVLHTFSQTFELEYGYELPNVVDGTGQPIVDNISPPVAGSGYDDWAASVTVLDTYYWLMLNSPAPVTERTFAVAPYFPAATNGQKIALWNQPPVSALPLDEGTISGGNISLTYGPGLYQLVLFTS